MAKEPRPKLGATSFILLLFFPLIYIVLSRTGVSTSFDSSFSGRTQAPNNHGHGGLDSKSNEIRVQEDSSQNVLLRRLVRGRDRMELESTGFSCDSDLHAEVCVIKEPVRIDARTLKAYLTSNSTLPHMKRIVRPYARKEEDTPMSLVSPVEILRNANSTPRCDITHNVSAVVFSSGGFSGNLFHEFNEIIVPLFLTSRHFRSELRFMITDFKPWWVNRYHRVLSHLSKYDLINPAEDGEGKVHCFPGAVVGLKYHDNLAIKPTMIPGGYSMLDFKYFLGKSFSLETKNELESEAPVLILISRQDSRKFLNEDEIVKLVKELGFRLVVVSSNQMSNLNKFAELVHSCSVMVGAHGAGLTNSVFLPEGAVVIQVVPLGLDWPATAYYGDPVQEMGLHYLEYKVNPDESSLSEKYGLDDPVITDPMSIHRQGYDISRAIYADGQNIKPNLLKFRQTLEEALKLVRSSNHYKG